MRTRTVTLAFLSLVPFGSTALADVTTPVSQTRSVSGTASATDLSGNDSDSASDQAVDFAPFASGAAANASVPDALGAGGGTLDSTLLGSTISAFGTSFANGEGYSPDGFGSGSGSSTFSYTFDLNQASNYSLSGYVEAFDNGSASMSLKQGGTTIFSASAFGEQVFIGESGLLAAGQYTLEASTSGSAFGDELFFDYASGAYDLTLFFEGSAPPAVTDVTPGTGPFTGGNIVTLTGSCFTPTTTVSFGGIPATSVTFVDEGTLTVEVPPHPLPTPVQKGRLVSRVSLFVDVTASNGASVGTLARGYVYAILLPPRGL